MRQVCLTFTGNSVAIRMASPEVPLMGGGHGGHVPVSAKGALFAILLRERPVK